MPSDAEEQGAWARPVSPRLGEIVMAVALLATAVFFVSQAALLPFGRVGLPGPGFFPFALGIVLGVLALAILVSLRAQAERAKRSISATATCWSCWPRLPASRSPSSTPTPTWCSASFMAVILLLVARSSPWQVAARCGARDGRCVGRLQAGAGRAAADRRFLGCSQSSSCPRSSRTAGEHVAVRASHVRALRSR